MSSAASKAIIIVDDDRDIREALVDTLTDEGYRAIGIRDGPGLLDYLGKNAPPAVVLLDWNMRPMNGAAVMREIGKKPAWAAIPVFLVTADARADEKMKADGFAGYLRKPLDMAELFQLIARYAGVRGS